MEQGSGRERIRMGRAAALALWAAMAAPAALFTSASAQAVTGELVSLGRKTGVGARAVGMGEAFTAVADDYSALYYNAAGMTQSTKSELGVNLGYGLAQNLASFQGGPGTQSTLEATRLNAVNLILRDGGCWALGLGYYSPVSFDDPLAYTGRGGDYLYDDEGRMDHYRLGLAYRITDDVSLGLAASAVSGGEQLEIQDGSAGGPSDVRYRDDYTGYNLEPSFLIHLSDMFSVGGSAVVAERLELDDTYQPRGGDALETFYDIRHPFQCRLGIAFQSGLTQVSADWHGDFWSGYRYSGAGDAFAIHDVNYPNKYTLSVGLEQRLAPRGPVLRAGYAWENADDRTPQPDARDPWRASVGMGFIPSQHVIFDVAYQYAGGSAWQNSQPGGPPDLNITQENQQVMASLRYRW